MGEHRLCRECRAGAGRTAAVRPGNCGCGSSRLPPAADICRGVARLLRAHRVAGVSEFALGNGRRADYVGLSAEGSIWIVEIKSCLADFRGDRKWPAYRAYCDRLYFAVAPGFPASALPTDAGLIIADRHGGAIVRPAPEHRLAAARRRAMTLKLARTAALRLHVAADPGAEWDA